MLFCFFGSELLDFNFLLLQKLFAGVDFESFHFHFVFLGLQIKLQLDELSFYLIFAVFGNHFNGAQPILRSLNVLVAHDAGLSFLTAIF